MSNLQQIYTYLKNNNTQNYHIAHINPPSYLDTITGCKDMIIFVCENMINQGNNELTINNLNALTPNKLKCLDIEDTLNFTGSPLKDNCMIDTLDLSLNLQLDSYNRWNENDEKFKPLALAKAYSVLCDINVQSIGEHSTGSVWCLCDATDYDKTGLVCLNFDKSFNSSGLICFKGFIPTNQLYITMLTENHFSKITGANKLETNIENVYKIKENISIILKYKTIDLNPALTNIKNSDCTLVQKIKLNDRNSLAADYYRQLTILNIIKDDIINFENNDEPVYRCGSGVNIDTLQENIIRIMTGTSDYSESDTNNCCEIETVVQRAKKRYSIDFTDQLWDAIKCCSSYEDLKTAMYYVFQCAAQRNIVNMPTNQNCLAQIIREVSQQRLAIPCLIGSEPLELLLEIGLEKLQKDYEYIFTESKICGSTDLYAIENSYTVNEAVISNSNDRLTSHHSLKPNNNKSKEKFRQTLLHSNNNPKMDQPNNMKTLGFQNSKFDAKETNSRIAKLTQIHLILEHLLSIQINLNLQNVYTDVCKQLLQKRLVEFDEIADLNYDEIIVSLSTDKIQPHVDSKDPHSRKISMLSSNKFKIIETTYYFSMENIFPPNIFPEINSGDKEMSKENNYMYWTYFNIKTRRN